MSFSAENFALIVTGRSRPPRYSNPQPNRPPLGAFWFIVVAGGLLQGAVLGLLHGFGERDALAGGFGEVPGAQAVG